MSTFVNSTIRLLLLTGTSCCVPLIWFALLCLRCRLLRDCAVLCFSLRVCVCVGGGGGSEGTFFGAQLLSFARHEFKRSLFCSGVLCFVLLCCPLICVALLCSALLCVVLMCAPLLWGGSGVTTRCRCFSTAIASRTALSWRSFSASAHTLYRCMSFASAASCGCRAANRCVVGLRSLAFITFVASMQCAFAVTVRFSSISDARAELTGVCSRTALPSWNLLLCVSPPRRSALPLAALTRCSPR